MSNSYSLPVRSPFMLIVHHSYTTAITGLTAESKILHDERNNVVRIETDITSFLLLKFFTFFFPSQTIEPFDEGRGREEEC